MGAVVPPALGVAPRPALGPAVEVAVATGAGVAAGGAGEARYGALAATAAGLLGGTGGSRRGRGGLLGGTAGLLGHHDPEIGDQSATGDKSDEEEGQWAADCHSPSLAARCVGAEFAGKHALESGATLLYKAPWGQVFGLKGAFYSADEFAADTDKWMVWTSYGI